MDTTHSGGLASPARVFWALLTRDAVVARRELPSFLLRTALQPLFFIVVFGFLLPKMNLVRSDYASTLLPGILAVSFAFSSMQAVSLPMVMDFTTNTIEDRLLSPIPTALVAAEKIVIGIIQGIISALFVLVIARIMMGPIEGMTLANLASIALVTFLGAAAFSSFGLLIGTAISPQQIGLLFSVVLTPMLFLGCAYYPWKGLDVAPVLKYAVLVNPLVYASEGMRGVLTPRLPHMSLPVVLLALTTLTVIFGWAGIRAFERRAIS